MAPSWKRGGAVLALLLAASASEGSNADEASQELQRGRFARAAALLGEEAPPRLARAAELVPDASGADARSRELRAGVIAYADGEPRAAVRWLRRAHRRRPSDGAVLMLLRRAESEAGFPPTESMPLAFSDRKIQDAREAVYQRRYLRAIQRCRELLEREPANITGLEILGSALYLLDRRDEARAAWERVLELDPGNRSVAKFLAKL